VFSRHGTDQAAAFLPRLTEKHDLNETRFLVDAYGYLTALTQLELNSRRHYTDRNHAE
jgi:putative transposase